MKIIVAFFIILSSFTNAQVTNSKEQPKMIYTEKAKFPGGDDAFRAEFFKMVHGYIDLRQYAVNGVFYFTFKIDATGKIKKLDVSPKVKDSEMFIDDMLFAMKKVKGKWKPAQRDGKPIESNYILSINFISDHFDHGD